MKKKSKTRIIKTSMGAALFIASALIISIMATAASFAEEAQVTPGYVPKVVWTRGFPEVGAMKYSNLDVYPNGDIAVAGYTYELDPTKKLAMKTPNLATLMRLDPSGQILWKQSFRNKNKLIKIRCVKVLEDGSLVAAGEKASPDKLFQDRAWAVRVGPKGGLLWKKEYAGKNPSSFSAVDAVPGHGIILAGKADANLLFSSAWLVKLDESGEIVWQTEMRLGVRAWFTTLRILPSGEFLASLVNMPQRNSDMLSRLIRFDAKGVMVSKGKVLKECELQDVDSLLVSSGGLTIACGSCNDGKQFFSPGGHKDDHIWLITLNQGGQVLWEGRLGPLYSAWGASLAALPDGRLAMAGTYDRGPPKSKAFGWLRLYDKEGEVMWGTLLEGEPGGINSLVSTHDGHLLYSGYTKTGPKRKTKTTFWISKIKP